MEHILISLVISILLGLVTRWVGRHVFGLDMSADFAGALVTVLFFLVAVD